MKVRPVKQTDDRYAISRVYEESWKSAYRGIIPQSYLDSIPEGNWASHLDDSNMNSLVMIEKDQIVGTASYCKSRFSEWKDYGEIVSIYLLPQYSGKGYGKTLFQVAVSSLKQMGFCDLFLWVLEDNVYARRFYEKNGFHSSGEYRDDEIGGKALREIQYTRHWEKTAVK